MQISNLVWCDVVISHKTRRKEFKKDELLGRVHITFDGKSLNVKEYDEYGYSTGKAFLFANPKVISLTPWECEFEAEWWGTSFWTDAKGKPRSKNQPNHKVKVTAKF